MFLALKNRGTDCFLIAAVNFLHASRRIMDWIIPAHFPATSLFLGRLQRVLSGTSLYVALLRERLGNHLSDTTRQHDSVEAVTNILANAEFEAEVLSAHQHVSVQGWNCGNCGWNANVEYTRKDVAVCCLFLVDIIYMFRPEIWLRLLANNHNKLKSPLMT